MKKESAMHNSDSREDYFDFAEIRQDVSDEIERILEMAGIESDSEVAIKEMKGEDTNSVFRLDVGDESFALKIFTDSKEAGQFYTNKAFNRLALENDISTPWIIYSNDDRELLPAPWIIWEWAPGRLSHEIESEGERNSAAVATGKELRRLHGIETDGFGRIDADDKWTGKDVKSTVEFYINRINNLKEKGGNPFSDRQWRDIFLATAESKELLSFDTPHLLHGDITGGNVLVENGKITLIDPGEIISGDPMADLGYSQITSLSPIFSAGVYEGYTKDHPLTEEENNRFMRWRLLRQCIVACRAELSKGKNAEKYASDALQFLEEIANMK